MPDNLSIRQLARLLKKFHVEDGDIIALRNRSTNANYETIEQLSKALGRIDRHHVLVIVVDDFDDMQVLNETEMNKRGWFRLEQISKSLRERVTSKHREERQIDKGTDIHV